MIYLKGSDIIELITPGVISHMKPDTIFEKAKTVKDWTRLTALNFLKDFTENLEREKIVELLQIMVKAWSNDDILKLLRDISEDNVPFMIGLLGVRPEGTENFITIFGSDKAAVDKIGELLIHWKNTEGMTSDVFSELLNITSAEWFDKPSHPYFAALISKIISTWTFDDTTDLLFKLVNFRLPHWKEHIVVQFYKALTETWAADKKKSLYDRIVQQSSYDPQIIAKLKVVLGLEQPKPPELKPKQALPTSAAKKKAKKRQNKKKKAAAKKKQAQPLDEDDEDDFPEEFGIDLDNADPAVLMAMLNAMKMNGGMGGMFDVDDLDGDDDEDPEEKEFNARFFKK